jgi:hypothetical protein
MRRAGRSTEHRRGDLALQRVEIVAHGPPGGGLPLAFHSEPIDLLFDPGEPDTLADLEVGLRGIQDGHAGGRCRLDQVEGAVQSFQGCNARRELFGDALPDEP